MGYAMGLTEPRACTAVEVRREGGGGGGVEVEDEGDGRDRGMEQGREGGKEGRRERSAGGLRLTLGRLRLASASSASSWATRELSRAMVVGVLSSSSSARVGAILWTSRRCCARSGRRGRTVGQEPPTAGRGGQGDVP